MTRDARLRRCLILCCHFARNLAYYRARRVGGDLARPGEDFWTSADGNFIDMAVMEWCKLLGDDRALHGWRKIVSDPTAFERDMLASVGVTAEEFKVVISSMRRYRDKFLAHLDSDAVMLIPDLEVAQKAAWFYYRHIWANEIDPIPRGSAPSDLDMFYRERLAAGTAVYGAAGRP
jgi:hypothetical protein